MIFQKVWQNFENDHRIWYFSNLVLKISLTLDSCHFSSLRGAEILKSDQQNCCGDVLLLFRKLHGTVGRLWQQLWSMLSHCAYQVAGIPTIPGLPWTILHVEIILLSCKIWSMNRSRHIKTLCIIFFALVGEVVHCVWRIWICDSKSLSLQIYTHTLPKQAGQGTAPCCYVRSEGLLDSVGTGILHMFEHC